MGLPSLSPAKTIADVNSIVEGFERLGYVIDRALATAIFLVVKMGKPILLEGHAGLGKTEVAKVLSSFLGTRLIRLQCYEGLDINSAVYEWNYQKQLLAIKIQENSDRSVEEKEKHIFSRDFLLERPLLRSILDQDASPVLLVDEIDRADEAFEAFLLELLSDFQISIPELGTIAARHLPLVVLTSNRNRELSDALKRRCLYHWIDYPDLEKELKIIQAKVPEMEEDLRKQMVGFVQKMRQLKLSKAPGVAETLDWARALLSLGRRELDAAAIEETLGCLSKSVEDTARIHSEGIDKILTQAVSR
ncbi:MAG TPA: MoxR family ATPase [Candidatus Angelobacter sp.]|nr:MoxR family ATPase [Candidatus Angelobacter sp.]